MDVKSHFGSEAMRVAGLVLVGLVSTPQRLGTPSTGARLSSALVGDSTRRLDHSVLLTLSRMSLGTSKMNVTAPCKRQAPSPRSPSYPSSFVTTFLPHWCGYQPSILSEHEFGFSPRLGLVLPRQDTAEASDRERIDSV